LISVRRLAGSRELRWPVATFVAAVIGAATMNAAAVNRDGKSAVVGVGDDQAAISRTQAQVDLTAQRVLREYADPALAALGFLDVTKAPYSAKPDGRTDVTAALKRALLDARDARLVVWLPAGTYLVSDTLECTQGAIDPKSEARGDERLRGPDYPCVIRGAGTAANGPTIRLAPEARGFSDPFRPRPVLLFQARTSRPPHPLRTNVSMNQLVGGLTVDVRGHAGAIGVDLQGAQASSVQDVAVEAAGAFAGLRGLSGSGGSTHQVTVRGGRYGILAAGSGPDQPSGGSQPAPLLAAATLTGQTVAAVHFEGRGPLTIVGARIEGAGIVVRGGQQPFNGPLNLIDSALESKSSAAIDTDRPVYVSNSWFSGTRTLVRMGGRTGATATGDGWTSVRELAVAPEGPYLILADGKRLPPSPATFEGQTGTPPPADLPARHRLPDVPTHWDAPGAVNAKSPPFGAKGDGVSDDAGAIQRALDAHGNVFLPKGRYRLGKPLVLGAGKKLFGAGRRYTVLLPLRGAAAFADGAAPRPLVETEDSPDGATLLARLELRSVVPGAYCLRWRAGARSAVWDVSFRRWPAEDGFDGPNVLIEGHGGGRWFNFANDEPMAGKHFRYLLVRGNRQPLSFYSLNIEHVAAEAMAELQSARDVVIYAFKTESFMSPDDASATYPALWIRESEGVRVYGAGGLGGVARGSPPFIYRVDASQDVLFTQIAHQPSAAHFSTAEPWSTVVDSRAGSAAGGQVLVRMGPASRSGKTGGADPSTPR
jgi:hypothetical protein